LGEKGSYVPLGTCIRKLLMGGGGKLKKRFHPRVGGKQIFGNMQRGEQGFLILWKKAIEKRFFPWAKRRKKK